jgi:hypothetical protein
LEAFVTKPHRATVEFDDFGWNALVEEAARQNVAPEALIVHAAMYYLADLDSGRAAARVIENPPGSEQVDAPEGGRSPRFERRDD